MGVDSVTANKVQKVALCDTTGAFITPAQQTITAAGVTATSGLPVQGMTGGIAMPVSGTFWQTTQPVSLASTPLPANAALETGGNLAAIATACTQAIPAGTAIIGKVGIDQTTPGTTNGIINNSYLAPATAFTTQPGPVMFAEVLTAPPSYNTNAQANPCILDQAGNLQVGNGTFVLNNNNSMTVTTASHGAGTFIGATGQHGVQFLKQAYGGKIYTITMSSKATVATTTIAVAIFSVIPGATFTDASATAFTAADLANIITIVVLGNPITPTGTTGTIWTAINLEIPVNSVNIWVVPYVAATAFTPGSTSDIAMKLTGAYG